MLLVLVAGCVDMIDPVTGEAYRQIDPNVVAGIQTGLAVTGGVAQSTSSLWPPAAIIVALAGVANAITGKLGKTRMKASLGGVVNAGSNVVAAIERFKTANPKEWDLLKPYVTDALGANAENVIRGWRGLPPKE